jgi:hypothetical protein
VTGKLKVLDVAADATAIFEHFVQGSPGVNALDVEVVYEKDLKEPSMRLTLPLAENGNDAARSLVEAGVAMTAAAPTEPAMELERGAGQPVAPAAS